MQKGETSIFQPEFGVCSTQMLVKIFKCYKYSSLIINQFQGFNLGPLDSETNDIPMCHRASLTHVKTS